MADIPYEKMIDKDAPAKHEVVTIEGDTLTWHNEDVVFLQLNLNEVVVIGEFTNSNGPWYGDWFLAFVTKQGTWSSIPFYIQNREEVIQALYQRFDPELKAGVLAVSTHWKSVVIYPAVLEGKELFKRVPSKNYKEPKNWWQKLLYNFGLGGYDLSKVAVLNDDVNTFIQNASGGPNL